MSNIVTCVKRIYIIQTSDGLKIEVESGKPLSDATTERLLKEDNDIGSFLENCTILSMVSETKDDRPHKRLKKSAKFKKRTKLKSAKFKKRTKLKSAKFEKKAIPEKSEITPCDRINMMITMPEEFTRLDYQKFLEDKGYKISDFMGYGDIEDAVMLKRISPTGEKVGKGRKKYKIVDTMPIEQFMFRKIMKNRKEEKKY